MTISSSPRGEHPGTPGRHWNTRRVTTGETVVPDCPATRNPDGQCIAWSACNIDAGECVENITAPPPLANRETRRAARRTT